jgi:hypothetical protein
VQVSPSALKEVGFIRQITKILSLVRVALVVKITKAADNLRSFLL